MQNFNNLILRERRTTAQVLTLSVMILGIVSVFERNHPVGAVVMLLAGIATGMLVKRLLGESRWLKNHPAG